MMYLVGWAEGSSLVWWFQERIWDLGSAVLYWSMGGHTVSVQGFKPLPV